MSLWTLLITLFAPRGYGDAVLVSEFYVVMHALAAMEPRGQLSSERINRIAIAARRYLPDGSVPAAMFDFVKRQHAAGLLGKRRAMRFISATKLNSKMVTMSLHEDFIAMAVLPLGSILLPVWCRSFMAKVILKRP